MNDTNTKLSVNLNKVALIRNARGRNFPDLHEFAQRTLAAGAAGVTVHPRPDQRHARYRDLPELKAICNNVPGSELNIEGNPSAEFIEHVLTVRPHQCTLVPDTPNQLTSDHGYDLARQGAELAPIIQTLRDAGIRVSLFMDPVAENMMAAAAIGAQRVELYTESYATTFSPTNNASASLRPYINAATAAKEAGLGVNAGHDLNLHNLDTFLREVPHILEVSIGHALTVEALQDGWDSVIRRYVDICRREHKPR